MKHSCAFLLLAILASCLAVGQTPSVQLIVKQKSGFLGLGGPRTVQLQLTTQDRAEEFTDDSLSSGSSYVVLCRPAEDWKLTPNFVNEDLASLAMFQGGQTYLPEWKSDIGPDSNGLVLFGFPKTARLDRSWQFLVRSGDSLYSAEMTIPERLWPGYTALNAALRDAQQAVTTKDFRHAIRTYEHIIATSGFDIFPVAQNVRAWRTEAFRSFLGTTAERLQALIAGDPEQLKQRIASLDTLREPCAFIADSLPRSVWGILPTEPAVAAVVSGAQRLFARMLVSRDSLQLLLDDRSIRWILEGSVSGRNGFQYQTMIEALACAFSSLGPSDTNLLPLRLPIPDDIRSRLQKFNLLESFETFLKVCRGRLARQLPTFPPEFLPNLRKDSMFLPLPYDAMFRAVQMYCSGSLAAARTEIRTVLRTSTVPEFSSAFDQLRSCVLLRSDPACTDILRLLAEADTAERAHAGAAVDVYRQLTLIAPSSPFVYYTLGTYYARTADTIRAQFAFQRAYQLDTLFLSAYEHAAALTRREERAKRTIEVLTLALDKGNDDWCVHVELGSAFLAENDPARAAAQFERALLLNPRSYTGNIRAGMAQQALKNFAKAREYYNTAIGIDPTLQEAVERLSKLNEVQKSAK